MAFQRPIVDFSNHYCMLLRSHADLNDRWGIGGRRSIVGTITPRPSLTFLYSSMEDPTSSSSSSFNTPEPQTFRDAEILGLKFMQEGQYERALQGTYVYVHTKASSILNLSISFFDFNPLILFLSGSAVVLVWEIKQHVLFATMSTTHVSYSVLFSYVHEQHSKRD